MFYSHMTFYQLSLFGSAKIYTEVLLFVTIYILFLAAVAAGPMNWFEFLIFISIGINNNISKTVAC